MADKKESSNKAVGTARARKRTRRSVVEANVYVVASFNNTIISLADKQGNVIAQSSAGASGFRGSRKSTPFAAQVAAEKVGTRARDEFGVKTVVVFVRGPGPGRESAIRSLISLGFKITEIIDDTGIPHNGCRPPKERRA